MRESGAIILTRLNAQPGQPHGRRSSRPDPLRLNPRADRLRRSAASHPNPHSDADSPRKARPRGAGNVGYAEREVQTHSRRRAGCPGPKGGPHLQRGERRLPGSRSGRGNDQGRAVGECARDPDALAAGGRLHDQPVDPDLPDHAPRTILRCCSPLLAGRVSAGAAGRNSAG